MTDYTYNTGNPIGSTDVRDGVDNLKSFDVLLNSSDDTYQDRLGNTVQTAAGAIKRLGPVVTAWTFTAGGTLNYPNEAALNPTDGNYYGWTGAFPKVVSPGTNPALPGSGYVPRTDVVLRAEITPSVFEALRRSYAEAGLNLVDGSFEEGGTLTSATDVLLHKASGIEYSGTAGQVAAGTNPASGGFVDRSGELLRLQLLSSVARYNSGRFVLRDTLSVKDFAGVIGDGIHDDTVGIQAAIDYAQASQTPPVLSSIHI